MSEIESTGSKLTRDDGLWTTRPKNCLIADNNCGGRSVWFDNNNIRRLLRILRVGDRLEWFSDNLPRVHWAIYVDELNFLRRNVVHFIPGNKDERAYSNMKTYLPVSLPSSKGVLIVSSIYKHASLLGGKVRINNSKDEDWKPVRQKYICQEISYQLKELQNRFVSEQVNVYVCRTSVEDSEDFVNYCRYDRDHQHYTWLLNGQKVTEWYSKANIEDFIREVQGGDRLEFGRRYPYGHWAIYIGRWGDDSEQIVHFAWGDENKETNSPMTSSGIGPSARPEQELCVESIRSVLGEGEVRINNERDQTWPALYRTDILDEIKSQLPGNMRRGACMISFKDGEDFVNYCRYDDWRINFGLVSEWCDSLWSWPRLRPGDRLEFKRTARPYAHWGIYLGELGLNSAQVVHFTPANGNGKIFSNKMSASGASSKNQQVLCVNHITEVLGNDKVRINNEKDLIWPPLIRTDILDKIKSQLESQSYGRTPVYRLFSNNCEHFVNHCRYGRHYSDQVSLFSRGRDRQKKTEVLPASHGRDSVL